MQSPINIKTVNRHIRTRTATSNAATSHPVTLNVGSNAWKNTFLLTFSEPVSPVDEVIAIINITHSTAKSDPPIKPGRARGSDCIKTQDHAMRDVNVIRLISEIFIIR